MNDDRFGALETGCFTATHTRLTVADTLKLRTSNAPRGIFSFATFLDYSSAQKKVAKKDV